MRALMLCPQDATYFEGRCWTIRHAHSAVLIVKARYMLYGSAASYVQCGIRSLDGFVRTTQVFHKSLILSPLLRSTQTN